jgi:hypothetical protein
MVLSSSGTRRLIPEGFHASSFDVVESALGASHTDVKRKQRERDFALR